MKKLSHIFIWIAVVTTAVFAQPEFDPVRLDEETDERFYFPTVEVTESNTFYCTWASANVDWIGAYGRAVTFQGELIGELDTVDIASTIDVSCPPRVEFRTHSGGAWCRMIYHE